MMQVRQATAPACWSDRAVWSCRADGAAGSGGNSGGRGGPGFGPQSAGLTRMAGEDRIQTAAALSRASFQPGVPVAFIATPGSFADALSAGPASAELGGPILLAGQDLPGATAEELARLRPERVVMVGGEAAVSGAVAESWSRSRKVRWIGSLVRIGSRPRPRSVRRCSSRACRCSPRPGATSPTRWLVVLGGTAAVGDDVAQAVDASADG